MWTLFHVTFTKWVSLLHKKWGRQLRSGMLKVRQRGLKRVSGRRAGEGKDRWRTRKQRKAGRRKDSSPNNMKATQIGLHKCKFQRQREGFQFKGCMVSSVVNVNINKQRPFLLAAKMSPCLFIVFLSWDVTRSYSQFCLPILESKKMKGGGEGAAALGMFWTIST